MWIVELNSSQCNVTVTTVVGTDRQIMGLKYVTDEERCMKNCFEMYSIKVTLHIMWGIITCPWWQSSSQVHDQNQSEIIFTTVNHNGPSTQTSFSLCLIPRRLITQSPEGCQRFRLLCDWSTGCKHKQKIVLVEAAEHETNRQATEHATNMPAKEHATYNMQTHTVAFCK